jgi:N-acetylglutamate synthase-like GNAT family acetyltransferase
MVLNVLLTAIKEPVITSIENHDIPRIVELLKSNQMNYSSVALYWEYFLKVEKDDQLIGCIAVIPRKGFSEIKSLLVTEEHRSFKIFNLMCEAIAQKTFQQNNPHVVLKVDRHNPAVLLYRRKGFVPLDINEYQDIYKCLLSDCTACHNIVKSICNPTYFIYDLRKTAYKNWLYQNET